MCYVKKPKIEGRAAIRQAIAEYMKTLATGLSNSEENLPKFMDALNAAIAQMQS